MMTADMTAAAEAAPPDTDLLQAIEQHPQAFTDSNAPTPKPAAAHACVAGKHFPFARIDRNTVRRTKRLGPALSLSTTRQIYPDEDAAAAIAA